MTDRKTLSRRQLLFGGLGRIKDKVAPDKPLHMDADLNEGDRLLAAREYPGAAACYRKCLARSPENPVARGRLGYCRMREGRLDDAVRELGQVLEKNPKDNFARLYLGLAQAMRGDLTAAADAWREYFNPSQLTLQREINIQTALMQTDVPPTPEEVVKAVEEAIEEQKRIILS